MVWIILAVIGVLAFVGAVAYLRQDPHHDPKDDVDQFLPPDSFEG